MAIDPGTYQSAVAVLDVNGKLSWAAIYDNQDLLNKLKLEEDLQCDVAIEMIQSYGMPVGREIFETCVWIGRFSQVLYDKGLDPQFYSRTKVKSYVTGSAKAKDKDVRQAMILRYGGTKKGEPLAGVTKDMWAALAVATYHKDGAILGGWKD